MKPDGGALLANYAEIAGAVARGWCSPENSHKEMDSTLAIAITREVVALIEHAKETYRLQIAAICTAAGQNTIESRKHRIDKEHPYWTPAYGEMCRAVDREIELREQQSAPSNAEDARAVAWIPVDRLPRLLELVGAACRKAAVDCDERSYELWTAVRQELSDASQSGRPAASEGEGWIAVGDRLPEENAGDVLYATKNGVSTTDAGHIRNIYQDARRNGEQCVFTHWRPLPQPPMLAAAPKTGEGEGFVRVPVPLLKQISTLMDTHAEFGMSNKYDNGSKTPNAEMCEQIARDIEAMLAASTQQ